MSKLKFLLSTVAFVLYVETANARVIYCKPITIDIAYDYGARIHHFKTPKLAIDCIDNHWNVVLDGVFCKKYLNTTRGTGCLINPNDKEVLKLFLQGFKDSYAFYQRLLASDIFADNLSSKLRSYRAFKKYRNEIFEDNNTVIEIE